MRSIILFSFLFISSRFFAQFTYTVDDYFNASNPSAFAEKKVFTSNTAMYSKMEIIENYNNFFSIKQRIGAFSLGINNQFHQLSEWKTVSNSFNAAYSVRINRFITMNAGMGISTRRDNFTFLDSAIPPIHYFTLWNPTSYGINIGMSLVSKKWTFGLAGNNLNRPEITTYPYTYKSPLTIAANASYRFDLDSAKHFSLTPSLFYRMDVNNHYNDFFLNLQFKAFQHSTGLFSTLNNNLGIFYQYQFKNNLSIGASASSNYSLLSSNIYNTYYLTGMLRLSYSIPTKVSYTVTGTPSF
ncbi:MAG: hypothetical protein ACO29U_06110 [Crocinitomicaceae bacterium]